MRRRLAWLGLPEDYAVQASVLELPFDERDASTTSTRSAACTTPATSSAACRRCTACCVPGGRAVVMLYNRHSLRRARYAVVRAFSRRRAAGASTTSCVASTTPTTAGEAAPHTDFVSRSEVRRLFRDFTPREGRRPELRRLRASASSASGSSATSRASSASTSTSSPTSVPSEDCRGSASSSRPATGPTCSSSASAASPSRHSTTLKSSSQTIRCTGQRVRSSTASPGPAGATSGPSKPVAMHDNFELACEAATGEYVAVVIDKTVLHPSALEVAASALEHDPHVDIVNWWEPGYDPLDESLDPKPGRFLPSAAVVEPERFDPHAELARRFLNEERRGVDPILYFRGKIVFGAYSRRLLERIRAQAGRVFHPLAADYTSMVPAAGWRSARSTLAAHCSSRTTRAARMAGSRASTRRTLAGSSKTSIRRYSTPCRSRGSTPHTTTSATTSPRPQSVAQPGARRRSISPTWRGVRARTSRRSFGRTSRFATSNTESSRPPRRASASRPSPPRPPVLASLVQRAGGYVSSFVRKPTTYSSPLEAARAADRHYAAGGRAGDDPRRRARLSTLGRDDRPAKAARRDRWASDHLAHHEHLRRARHQRLRDLRRLQGLPVQGVLREPRLAQLRRHLRLRLRQCHLLPRGAPAMARDGRRHRRQHDDRRTSAARS